MSEWRARCMTSCAAKRNPLRPGQRRSKRMCTFCTCCPVTEGVCAAQQHLPAAPCILLVGIGDRCRVQAVVAAGLALVDVAVAAGPHIDAVPLGGIYAVVPAHSDERQIASGRSLYHAAGDSWAMAMHQEAEGGNARGAALSEGMGPPLLLQLDEPVFLAALWDVQPRKRLRVHTGKE